MSPIVSEEKDGSGGRLKRLDLIERVDAIEEKLSLHVTGHVTGTEIFKLTDDVITLKNEVKTINLMLKRLAKGMPHINFMSVED